MKDVDNEGMVQLHAAVAGPIVLLIAFVVLALIFFWTPSISEHFSEFPFLSGLYWVVGRYGLPAFGLLFLVFEYYKRLSGRSIKVSDYGIEDGLSSQRLGFIPWIELSSVQFDRMNKHASIALKFKPECINDDQKERFRRGFMTRVAAPSSSSFEADFIIAGVEVNEGQWSRLKQICPRWVNFFG